MKKFLVFALMLGSMVFAVPSTEAKTTAITGATAPQTWRTQQRRNRNRRVYTTTSTRVVRTRYGAFREVYRITHYPNGRTVSRLISRTRIYR